MQPWVRKHEYQSVIHLMLVKSCVRFRSYLYKSKLVGALHTAELVCRYDKKIAERHNVSSHSSCQSSPGLSVNHDISRKAPNREESSGTRDACCRIRLFRQAMSDRHIWYPRCNRYHAVEYSWKSIRAWWIVRWPEILRYWISYTRRIERTEGRNVSSKVIASAVVWVDVDVMGA